MRIHLITLALSGLLTTIPASSTFAAPDAPEQAAGQRPAVNLNVATAEQLMTLPGIGQKTAERIIEYRTKSGGFKKIEELMNIKGIGEKIFLKLKPLVSAPPKTDKPGA